jgi:hypothetical protein
MNAHIVVSVLILVKYAIKDSVNRAVSYHINAYIVVNALIIVKYVIRLSDIRVL